MFFWLKVIITFLIKMRSSSYNKRITTMATPTLGVKGSDVYESTGDPRVDLSVMLNRGLATETIRIGLDKIFAMGTEESFEDAFVLAFQTRNVRGGKGERELSKQMFLYLLEKHPHLTREHMLDLIPKFGCWRDLFTLAADGGVSVDVKGKIYQLTAEQLKKDLATPDGEPVSLCAKWAPREDKKGPQAKMIASLLFPAITKFSDRAKAYRQMVAGLNRRIQTTEIKMCAGDWEEIEPAKVPGRCLQKHRKAFLNEKIAPHGSRDYVAGGTLRHPDDLARMACREHFEQFFADAATGKVKVKAADVVFPHEVIQNVLKAIAPVYSGYYGEAPASSTVSNAEKDLLRAQWLAIVDKAREGGALKNCLAMCDFSGSMDGMPKLICTALGLLVAEVNGTNKILTFDSLPQWHQFPEGDIFAKVGSISHSLGQGLSTDFQKAMDMVLADVKTRRLRPEEIPKDLIVFTDMGWDQACGSNESSYSIGNFNSYRHNVKTAPWQTHIEMIRESFKRAGEDMWGVPFEPPRIVVWNLRAEYQDFHATADQEGVVMLSGWSPALFKVLQEQGVAVMTPLEALRYQLDDPMYAEVRQRVRAARALGVSV